MTSRTLAVVATVGLIVAALLFGPTGSESSESGENSAVTQNEQPKNNQVAPQEKQTANKRKPGQKKQTGKKKRTGKKKGKQPLNRLRTDSEYVAAMHNTARAGGADVLSTGDSSDDFASVAQSADGTVWVAYAAYYDGHDQIRLHRRLPNGRWSTRTNVPLVRSDADIWMPQLAVDAADRLWVIWSEQTGQSKGVTGNWDLYARPLIETRWGKTVRLTNNAKPDINQHVATDADGNIHVVWQAHPENNGDVQYCRFDGKTWSKPLAVTSDDESDWYPRVAIDGKGTAWIAFDSYRNGDYDVFLTSVSGNKPGKIISIATSTFYEAHASVACTPDGAVWVGWERGGHNWGKDQGYWLNRNNRNQGTTLGNTRSVKVARWKDGELLAAPGVNASLPMGTRVRPSASCELTTGTDGRLWLRFRHVLRGRERRPGRFTKGWTEHVTHLTSEGWAPAVKMPGSVGRISVFSRSLAAKDGSLWVAYSGDGRAAENFHRPIQDNTFVKQVVKPDVELGVPELAAYETPEPPVGMPRWNAALERKQTAAIRAHRVKIDGKEHRIVRGDLHRHTELSWDVGPGNDGSYLDFYRYMIDVASMDFGGLTDHQGGGHYSYWWWLTEKSADMYYLAPRFVPLYSYERSARFPNGHRNIFHSYRGVPVFPFQITTDQTAVFPGVSARSVMDNDTKLLYEALHKSGGIAISHTSGTSSMGTDWRDNDPLIEPVVEIYQGARNSYEAIGAPRVHSQDEPPGRAPGGFQKAGMLWNAYKKGYRLGITASSDHGSTHISYALVYTPKNDRVEILDSIRKRHTYGATDNLIVTLTANGRFMGDEYKTADKPSLVLSVMGTGPIAKVVLVRDNQYVYTVEPGKPSFEIKYTDMTPQPGTHLYYFRITQQSGEVAWSSPVWVKWEAE